MIRATLCLALIAGSAGAQNATESNAPQKAPEQRPAPERPRLNLKLDNPSSFATTKPEQKESPKELPGLGADAQRLPPSGMSTSNPTFPKDTNPGK